MSQDQHSYSVYQNGSAMEEELLQVATRNSTHEIPPSQLRFLKGYYDFSGDEAVEKSFMSMTQGYAKKSSKPGIFLSSIIIMKSMVGVGILGIPYVARNFGVVIMIMLVLFVYFYSFIASNILLKSKNLSTRSNFSTIGFWIFKHKWIIILINLMIIITNIGVCLSELIIFGDTIQNIINFATDRKEQPFYLSRPFFIILVSILLYPALIVKSIEKLKFVSLFAIISISCFTILVIFNYAISDQIADGYSLWLPDDFNFARGVASLPTIILAFTWQFNLFPVYKGMEQPSDQRLLNSTLLGFTQATILYLTVGILGYGTYGNNIESNYLLSIDQKTVGSALYVILNSAFVISSTFTLPVIFFGGRNNFIQLMKQFGSQKVYGYSKSKEQINVNDQLKFKKRKQKIRFYGVSTFLFVCITIGAIFIRSLGLVFNIIGSISCNAIQLGFPTLFYIALVIKVKRFRFENIKKRIFFYFICFLLILSLFLTVFCVFCEFV